MPRNGADFVPINGRANAVNDADQETNSFSDLRYIRETVSRFPEHADKASDASLPPEAKERIKAKLAEQAR